MADGVTLVKAPEEQVSKFNTRLLTTCGEFPVTNVQLAIVDGQPCVTLFSESVEAEQEDVDEAERAGEKLEVGDLIPSEDPVCVQVCPMHAHDVSSANKTQARMETLYKRADGAITAVLHASGRGIAKLTDPLTKKETLVEKDVHFAAVVYNPSEAEEDTQDDAQDGGASADG